MTHSIWFWTLTDTAADYQNDSMWWRDEHAKQVNETESAHLYII